MSGPLRFCLAVVLVLAFGGLCSALIAQPWSLLCSLVGGISLGFLFAKGDVTGRRHALCC